MGVYIKGSKNLLNIFGRTKGDINGRLTDKSNVRADMLDESKYYLGWARNNYTNPNAATMIFNEDNSITGYTKASGYGTAFPVKCKPNTTYTLSLTKSNIYAMIGYGFYDVVGVFIKGGETSKNSTLITTPDKCSWIVFTFGYQPQTQGEYTYSNIMLNEGTVALPYEDFSKYIKVKGITEVWYKDETVSEAFTTRQTANGMTVVDPSPAIVKKIKGKTVKCNNLLNAGVLTFAGSGGERYFSLDLNGTYTFHYKAKFSNIGNSSAAFIRITVDGSPKYITAKNENYTSTITGHITAIDFLNWSVVTGTVYDIMLNEGNTALPYEEYFQGLKHANFEKIVSTGRNLFDVSKLINTTVDGDYFTGAGAGKSFYNLRVTPLGTYSVTFTVKTGDDGIDTQLLMSVIAGKDESYSSGAKRLLTVLKDSCGEYSKTYQFTVPENVNWVSFSTITTNLFRIDNFMINEGSTALPYEPYTSNEFALSAPVELPEWDYIDPQTGEIVRQTNTFVFDGTENWRLADASLGEFGVTASFGASMSQSKYGNGICNRYTFEPNGGFTNRTCRFAYGNGNTMYFYDKAFTTLEAWKAYLAELYANGNPLTISYLTKTTTEPLDIPKQYTAHNGGSETVVQGTTDNSKFGAKATVETTYKIPLAKEERYAIKTRILFRRI